MDQATLRKRRDLITVLVDNACNPKMLYQLVSTSSTARDMYEEWPAHYLKTSVSSSREVCQVATAYIALLIEDQDFYRNSLPDLPLNNGDQYLWPLDDPINKSHNEKLRCSQRHSQYTDFLDKYLGSYKSARLPTCIRSPLRTLRKVMLTYEAIETLTTGEIWNVDTLTPAIPIAAHRDTIRLALWRLQLLGTLYWDVEKKQRTKYVLREGTWCPEQIDRRDQRRFLQKIGAKGTVELAKIYDDLLWMLQRFYSVDLAQIFEGHLKAHVEAAGLFPLHPSLQHVTEQGRRRCRSTRSREVEKKFNGYLHYRISLGMQGLSEIYRTQSAQVPLIDSESEDNKWTDQFFTKALLEHEYDGFKRISAPHTSLVASYRLLPVSFLEVCNSPSTSDTGPGYKLVIVLEGEGWAFTRRLAIEQPIFEHSEVEEVHLGGILKRREG